jgi:site-specific recombinase XerD
LFARQGIDGNALVETIPVHYSIKRLSAQPTKEDADRFEKRAKIYIHKKMRPIFNILLKMGLRAEEFLALTREQVVNASETGALHFVRKGGREAELPCEHVQSDFKALLSFKAALPHAIQAQQAVIQAGGPFDWERVGHILTVGDRTTQYNLLNRAVKDCARRAGLDTKLWSPHKLRHAFATRMHEDGAPIRVVQEALGHLQVTTTQRYINVERGDIAKYVR